MINVKEENKALCFQDSTSKPLSLYMYTKVESEESPTGYTWRLFRVLDEEIILESAKFDEGILEGGKFTLGSFVIPELNIEWRNDGIRYTGFVCIPVQQIGDEYIAYFNGYVEEETVNSNGTIVKAKIKSLMGEKLSISLYDIIQLSSEPLQTAFINDYEVNMRTGPGVSYGIVGKYSYEQVEIISSSINEKNELWYYLKIISTGDLGYIREDFITIEEKYIEEVAYIISTALKRAGIISFDDWGNLSAEEYLAEKLKNNFENAKITFSHFKVWEYAKILSKLTLKDLLKQTGEFLGCQVLVSSKRKVEIEQLLSDQPGFYEGIDFVRILNLDNLSNSEICRPNHYININYDKTPLPNENLELDYNSKVMYMYDGEFLEMEVSPSIAGGDMKKEKTEIIIKDNFLFNKLTSDLIDEQFVGGQVDNIDKVDIEKLMLAITPPFNYIRGLNYYNSTIDYPALPFLMPNDVIVVDGENQKYMPKEEFSALEYVEIGNGLTVDTGIVPTGLSKEIVLEFEIAENTNVSIFESYGSINKNYNNWLSLEYVQANGNLVGNFGSFAYLENYEKPTVPSFSISPIVLNQKLIFNSSFENNTYSYNGVYKGYGNYNENGGYETNLTLGNGNGKFKLYHFKYMENHKDLIELYPCMRKIDNAIGFYDIANNNFVSIIGTKTPNYLKSEIAIPILSCNSKGIHSMRSTAECKATQLKSGG